MALTVQYPDWGKPAGTNFYTDPNGAQFYTNGLMTYPDGRYIDANAVLHIPNGGTISQLSDTDFYAIWAAIPDDVYRKAMGLPPAEVVPVVPPQPPVQVKVDQKPPSKMPWLLIAAGLAGLWFLFGKKGK